VSKSGNFDASYKYVTKKEKNESTRRQPKELKEAINTSKRIH
jgi:hypothetical protein